MYTGIMVALVAMGAIFLLWAYRSSNSLASGFSELFTGTPTENTVWLLLGGLVLIIVGIGGLLRGRRQSL